MSPITQSPLLAWVDKPHACRGVRFLGRDGAWQRYGYDRLCILARAVAGGIRDRGLRRGDAVAIVQPSGPHFIASLFGVLLAGGTASPVAPPGAFQDAAVYAAHVTGALSSAGVRFVVVADDLHDGVAPLARATGAHATLRASALLDATPAWTRRDPAELALLQFTSGSSGRARAVRVPYAAVAANIAALDAWVLGPGPGAAASWLPVHHDMGLVGCLLTPVVNRRDLWLMTPEQFIRSPLRYLRCFSGEGAAAATAMPTFGLDHVVRRVREDDLSDIDLSGWRSLVIGAERVDAPTLDRFHALLRAVRVPPLNLHAGLWVGRGHPRRDRRPRPRAARGRRDRLVGRGGGPAGGDRSRGPPGDLCGCPASGPGGGARRRRRRAAG